MIKNSGAPVRRGLYDGHLTESPLTAHGIFARIIAGAFRITQDAWVAPSLLNSWVNYNASYNSAGYFKDTCGVVHLRGILKDGTLTASAFLLPVGYRPSKIEGFGVMSNGAFGYCWVSSDGNVVPQAGSNTMFSLDGITFRAA